MPHDLYLIAMTTCILTPLLMTLLNLQLMHLYLESSSCHMHVMLSYNIARLNSL
jgi:hypothetical protein